MATKSRKLIPGQVYEFSYDCTVRGCDDQGVIEGYWTGEVDTWGKFTIMPTDGGDPFYLFADEIFRVDALQVAALIPELKSRMRVL